MFLELIYNQAKEIAFFCLMRGHQKVNTLTVKLSLYGQKNLLYFNLHQIVRITEIFFLLTVTNKPFILID